MAAFDDPVCFQCGQAFNLKDELPSLPDGSPCPACAERMLASLPSLLPSASFEEEEPEAAFAPLEATGDNDPPQPA
jgi:hypothetical protein